MTKTPWTIGNLVMKGKIILTGVPDNILLNPGVGAGTMAGTFLGASAGNSKSLHMFPMGSIEGLRFVCCPRFKLWVVESKEEGQNGNDGTTVHIIFFPLLEGQLRTTLQVDDGNQAEIYLESAIETVKADRGSHIIYVHAGNNPSDVITHAVKQVAVPSMLFNRAVEMDMQTFHCRVKNKLPSFLDEGLKRLWRGGIPPCFFIIDDAWQKIGDETKKGEDVGCVAQGDKYHRHAPAGHWGGVTPSGLGMEPHESGVALSLYSERMIGNQPDIVIDSLAVHDTVHPRKVYDELHAYLASCGVDGVIIDVHNIIETLGKGHAGRASLIRSYCKARAVGRYAIYVGEPGHHNSDLLRELVLFDDPARDGTNLLKIWNINTPCAGVKSILEEDAITQVPGLEWKEQVIDDAYESGEASGMNVPVTTLQLVKNKVRAFCNQSVKQLIWYCWDDASYSPINIGGVVQGLKRFKFTAPPKVATVVIVTVNVVALSLPIVAARYYDGIAHSETDKGDASMSTFTPTKP